MLSTITALFGGPSVPLMEPARRRGLIGDNHLVVVMIVIVIMIVIMVVIVIVMVGGIAWQVVAASHLLNFSSPHANLLLYHLLT